MDTLKALLNLIVDAWRGELNQSQITRFITNAFTRGARLDIKSPHPCDTTVQVIGGLSWSSLKYELVDWDLQVDGKPAKFGPGPCGFIGQFISRTFQFYLADLSVGHHDLKLTVKVLPNPPYVSNTTSKPQEICFTLPGEVVVDTSRVVDHVKLRWLPEVADQVRNSAEVMSRLREPGSYGSGVYLRLWPSPIPLAANIEVRPHGQGPYTRSRDSEVAVWASEGRAGPTSPSVEVPVDCDQIDIRLIPDPKVAFRHDRTECLNAIIEWHDVPVFRTKPASESASSTSTPADEVVVKRHPTLVYEATSTRPSE